ncbi:MAG: glycosyltransferase family A protein [Cytophagales bacterium]|nr:glycosyltransferase family A protein [Cytophagales bacterium]
MPSSPLVSILIPAYNAQKHIASTILSILKQDYKAIEIIIVNDGSTDATENEVKRINDHRIILINQTKQGAAAARNAAFKYSKGQFIKYLDADDMISPHMLKAQVQAILPNANAIAYSDWGRFKISLNDFVPHTELYPHITHPLQWLKAHMYPEPYPMLQVGRFLLSRHLVAQAGTWNTKLSLIDDFEYMVRTILASHKLIFTPKEYLYYRSGNFSLSAHKSHAATLSAFNSVKLATEYLLQHDNSEDMRLICANCFQDLIYNAYPFHASVRQMCALQIRALGGSDFKFPSGGITRFLSAFIGWKATKLLKTWLP